MGSKAAKLTAPGAQLQLEKGLECRSLKQKIPTNGNISGDSNAARPREMQPGFLEVAGDGPEGYQPSVYRPRRPRSAREGRPSDNQVPAIAGNLLADAVPNRTIGFGDQFATGMQQYQASFAPICVA